MHLNYYQTAYITRNRDKAVAMLRERHGMTDDFILFEPDIEVKTPKGVGRAQTRVALGWAGRHQIEIIEPVSGLVDLYYPSLPQDDHSLGFHHTAVRVDEWDAFKTWSPARSTPSRIKAASKVSNSSISMRAQRWATTSSTCGRRRNGGSSCGTRALEEQVWELSTTKSH